MKPTRSLFRQLLLYAVLPGLPLLLFFMLWRLAEANAGRVLQSASSPDGVYVAELIRHDPGGDASYDYFVRVRRAQSKIVDPLLRNEYRAFDQHNGGGDIHLDWAAPAQLTISCTGCTGYKLGKASWHGVRLRYEMQGFQK